ncbi:MAG: carbonic anhydrase [Syntrophotaleaceae bacterium]
MEDIARLIAGFRRFQENYFRGDTELYDQLKEGQQPSTLVIGCSDSRVDPAILMDSAPGDLFVVRNVANLVPPYEPDAGYHGVSAALEYAVRNLRVTHIIVLGHSQCGGIDSLMKGPKDGPGEFIGSWVGIAAPARDEVLERLSGKSAEQRQRACEQAAILLSLDNLLTFPWVQQRAEQGDLFLHGWYFDMARGELLSYDAGSGAFRSLVQRPKA